MKYYTKGGQSQKSTLNIRNNKIEEIYKFIDNYKGYYCEKIYKNFEIKTMCNVLRISRAAYYKHVHKKPSRYEKENEILDKEILEEYTASKRCYDALKIQKVLLNKGIKVSIKRIQRRMKKLDIRSIVIKNGNHPVHQKIKLSKRKTLLMRIFQLKQ